MVLLKYTKIHSMVIKKGFTAIRGATLLHSINHLLHQTKRGIFQRNNSRGNIQATLSSVMNQTNTICSVTQNDSLHYLLTVPPNLKGKKGALLRFRDFTSFCFKWTHVSRNDLPQALGGLSLQYSHHTAWNCTGTLLKWLETLTWIEI